MDYKTNILKTQIEVKDDLLQGIKGLVFGMTDDGVVVLVHVFKKLPQNYLATPVVRTCDWSGKNLRLEW